MFVYSMYVLHSHFWEIVDIYLQTRIVIVSVINRNTYMYVYLVVGIILETNYI